MPIGVRIGIKVCMCVYIYIEGCYCKRIHNSQPRHQNFKKSHHGQKRVRPMTTPNIVFSVI